jgi:protein-tyrosine phosphatase
MRHFLFLKSLDEETFPILDTHFATLLRYIQAALVDGNRNAVYIHCYAGINRSATLAIAYACHLTKKPAAPLIAEVRRATGRHVVENEGFYRQLTERFPIRQPTAPTPTPESSVVVQSAAP